MKTALSFLALTLAAAAAFAANSTFTIDAGHPAGSVSPGFYGLMTEEINHSYDGGLYAELVQNRAFLDDAAAPAHWSAWIPGGGEASIALDPGTPCNEALTTSLKVTVTKASAAQPAGVANSGYWGIPVEPSTKYRATLIARAEEGFAGPVTVSIVSDDGRTVYASGNIPSLTGDWKKYELTLKTGSVEPTAAARLAVTLDRPGTIRLGYVSLFPPTWKDQPNGFRPDLMQLLVDMNPKFLRFPGGNYVEGDTVETRFDWKKTIGPVENRPGHRCPWGYRSSDGLGLMEFLMWCEDMNAEPVLAVYAGYNLKGTHVNPGPDLEPFVKEALEEIEYVAGGTNTAWGAARARDGHPAPFPLKYVEIGNEDWFDRSGSYDQRFAQFYDAIKAKYPDLQLISTIGYDQPKTNRVRSRKPDMMDEHYYSSTDEFIRTSPDYGKKYDRNGPKVFVGEWAAHEDGDVKPWSPGARKQPPTPTFKAALGDAVFMAAMERNADLVLMNCYAPLFVNVNPGGRQWRPDMIGYDALTSYGSPSYYAFQMFSRNIGDEVLPVSWTGSAVQGSATRDSKTGEIFIKLVNPNPVAETVDLKIEGVAALESKGRSLTLSANPEDTNSIRRPRNVVPEAGTVKGVQPSFSTALPPNSIVVLKLKGR